MSTEPNPAADAQGTAPVEPKQPRSFGSSLKDGAGNILRFTSVVRKDGTVDMHATHITKDKEGKPVSARGASQKFPNLEAGRAGLEKAARKAKDAGWSQSKGAGVARQKPDTFDLASLPKPRSK
jgi:hypothetical protein